MRVCYLLLIGLLLWLPGQAQWSVDFESGVAFNSWNTFRIPGDEGTKVNLSKDFDVDPVIFTRSRLSYTPIPRETWSLLIAPLEFTGSGQAVEDIRFNDVIYPAGTALNAGYEFNSYRLTYRKNRAIDRPFSYGYGVTLKIREADIALSSAEHTSHKYNLGVVPLINFRANWQISERCGLLVEGDALAAPQGRAEDVMVALTYQLNAHNTLRAGYRMLEGGADNDAVYTFALLNYALIGVEHSF